jgi:hypothetical protein
MYVSTNDPYTPKYYGSGTVKLIKASYRVCVSLSRDGVQMLRYTLYNQSIIQINKYVTV